MAAVGAVYTGGAQVIRALSTIVTTIIVARILSPDDFGVLAMSAPVLAFVQLFQDLGFSAATIQTKNLRAEQSSTLFWVNVAASVALATLLIIVSPAVAAFYGDERVGHVTAASAAMVFLGSFAIQHTALLTRHMRFRQIAAIVIFSALANTAVTILLAWYLGNYWALFLGTLGGTIVQLVLTWKASQWRPASCAPWGETRSLIGFGGYVAAFDLLNFLNRNADSILLGRFWGAAPLGLYERSQKLMLAPLQLVNSPLTRVMLPLLSRLREDPDRYREAYLFALRGLLLATVPPAAVAIAASDSVIVVLLGPAWRSAAPIFFWLAFATLYQPLGNSMAWLFLSSGRAKAYAQWGLLSSVITVSSFAIGVRWGPVGVAMAYVIGGVILRVPALLYWAPKGTPVQTSDILKLLPGFAIAGAVTWAAVTLLDRQLSAFPLVVAGLLISYFVATAVQLASPDGRHFFTTLFRLLNSLRRAPPFEEREDHISSLARALSSEGLTYLSAAKLARLESALDSVSDVPGDFAEFGVALGGSAILIASRADGRSFHGFDVFGMIPPPSSPKDDAKSRARHNTIREGKSRGLKGADYYGYRADLFSEVKANFARHSLPVDGERIVLHKGLFDETLPTAGFENLAFAHIDCDWYDPVRLCLRTIGSKISPGGAILVDDFHDYGGCRMAVEEFLADNPQFVFEDGPNPLLRRVR
jgi:PST family polysaccharide transporter